MRETKLEEIKTYWDNGKLKEIYYEDSQGRKQGKYEKYFDDGESYRKKCEYKDDKLNGLYQEWYFNDDYYKYYELDEDCLVLDNICTYVDGKIHGIVKNYDYDEEEYIFKIFNHGKSINDEEVYKHYLETKLNK